MKNSANPEREVKEYSLIIKSTPAKFLERIDDKTFDKIDNKIISLKTNPYPRNSKKFLFMIVSG